MDHYIVSARKYRPATFDTVVGQHALTTTLKNAIASGKLAHAYLFCGPRGVGKTTCARIFAKTINCLNPKEDGEACGVCESCKAFEEGRSYNISELDAASNNSVEDIRSLIEQVMMPPQVGHYKVFIIDEVHMLSQAAFNAFLKTLEEPPAHAIFILATTEKHKILPTILSRCQIYDFNRMEVNDIVEHLKQVAGKEHIQFEEEALAVIARKADGGMRDAMSIFDQVASYTEGNITYKKVIEDLNILDYDYYFAMTDHLLKTDIPAAMLLLNDILSKGFQGIHFVNGLASHFRDLLVAQDEQTLPLLEVAQSVRERYREQARRAKPRFLYSALKLCKDCDINYRASGNKRLLAELTLIEIGQAAEPDSPACGPGPTKKLTPLFQAAQPAEAQKAHTQTAAPAHPHPQVQTTPTVPYSSTPSAQTTGTQGLKVEERQTTNYTSRPAQSVRHTKTISLRPTPAQPTPAQSHTPTPEKAVMETVTENQPFDAQALSYNWYRFAASLPKEQAALAGRMQNIEPIICENGQIDVPVENEQVIGFMEPITDKLTVYLRQQLRNASINLRFRLTKPTEKRKAYSRKEMYEVMLKKSVPLTNLVHTLHLELS